MSTATLNDELCTVLTADTHKDTDYTIVFDREDVEKWEEQERAAASAQTPTNTTKKEEIMIKTVDEIFDISTTAEEQNFDEAFREEFEADKAYLKSTKEEEEEAYKRLELATEKCALASEVLAKKQEQVARFKQICDAIKTAIKEAKEEGVENEDAFSCDVIFDEDGCVEYAKVAFYENRNLLIIYEQGTATSEVKALYDPNYFTDETNHENEVFYAASAIVDMYEENLVREAEEAERREIYKLIRRDENRKAAAEEREYRAIFG